MKAYHSLLEPILERAQESSERVAVHFVAEDGSAYAITFGLLHRNMLAYGHALRASDIRPKGVVVLALQHSLDLIYGFWGTVYLGAIPSIFPYLTEKVDPGIYRERVRTLVGESGATVVITFSDFKAPMAELVRSMGCRVLTPNDVASSVGGEKSPPVNPHSRDVTALLQYSSGTTGLQKGVMFSHGAILDHIEALAEAYAIAPADVVVTWLPLYHDMGLVTGFLLPLIYGIPAVMMSPFHWVRQPKILFQAMHAYQGTMCWMPNFAFNHCVRTVQDKDLQGIDLRAWRIACNGSEPVRPESLQMFYERFAPYGFRESALNAGYGMAENVVGVSVTPVGRRPRVDWVHLRELRDERRAVPLPARESGATAIVSCGFPLRGTEVTIVDDDGNRLPERHVGNVLLRSPYMLTGYHRRPDLTAEAIREGWLHTGDLGYVAGGELYVCGRKTDLIIVGGRNIHPQELEAIAGTVAGIRAGRAVAFGVLDERLGSERVVMVCETAWRLDEGEKRRVERELRQRMAQELDVTLGDVRLVDRRWVIKTSNGKLARPANRDRYLQEFTH
jgi:fatty-acyl-CoA synthase